MEKFNQKFEEARNNLLFYSLSRLLVSIYSFVIGVIVFSTIPEIASIGIFMPIIFLIVGFGHLYYGAYFLDRSILFAAVADGCEESNRSILYSYKEVKHDKIEKKYEVKI